MISKYQQMLFISIENSNFHPILTDEKEGIIRSSKENPTEHGYGLENIKRTVKKYDGQVSLDFSDTYFKLYITLPIPAEVRQKINREI